jgi:hypothetical protein
MASKPPGDIQALPPYQPTIEDLTKGPELQFVHKHGMVVDNGVYGRVHTKMCYADRREERLDDLQQDWAKYKDTMTAEQANAFQEQMSSIQQSIDPNQQYFTSGPTAAQKAYFKEQQENWEDLKATEDEPFGFVSQYLQWAGVPREKARAVSVILNAAGDVVKETGEQREKVEYKPPF